MRYWPIIIINWWNCYSASVIAIFVRNSRICQPIEIESCRDLPYNLTSMPNFVGNDEQSEADMQLSTFEPLIQVQCSAQLKFFLCSLYAPMCTDKIDLPIGPCRPLCESVRECCEPTLRQFGFPWPDLFNCSAFPAENNAQSMCMRGPGPGSGSLPNLMTDSCGPVVPRTPVGFMEGQIQPKEEVNPKHIYDHVDEAKPFPIGSRTLTNANNRKFAPCDSEIFAHSQASFCSVTLFILSSLCVVTSILLLLLSWMKKSRQKYQHEPVAFDLIRVSFCYAVYCYGLGSLGPLLRLVFGRQATACVIDSLTGSEVLVSAGLHNTLCTVVAVSGFYFWTAAQTWLLVACLLWLLLRPLQVDETLLNQRRFYAHMLCWMAPLVQTASVLAHHRAIDADPCTGSCWVGHSNSDALIKFLILPQTLYCLFSSAAFLAGFYFRRSKTKASNNQWIAPLNKASTIRARTPQGAQNHQPINDNHAFEFCLYFLVSFLLLACNIFDLIFVKGSYDDNNNNRELHFWLNVCKILSTFAPGVAVGLLYLHRILFRIPAACSGDHSKNIALTSSCSGRSTHYSFDDDQHRPMQNKRKSKCQYSTVI